MFPNAGSSSTQVNMVHILVHYETVASVMNYYSQKLVYERKFSFFSRFWKCFQILVFNWKSHSCTCLENSLDGISNQTIKNILSHMDIHKHDICINFLIICASLKNNLASEIQSVTTTIIITNKSILLLFVKLKCLLN
jgi:hypothetical protein